MARNSFLALQNRTMCSFNFNMNISKRSRRVFEDEDEHMNMNRNKKIHHDIVCISNIPEDLIMEILLRLPPISVHRFRRVCKHWHSLISNPDFLRTHSSSSPFGLHNTTHGHELLLFSNSRGFKHGHQLHLFSNDGEVKILPRLECVPLIQFEVEDYRKPPPPFRKLSLDLSTNSVHYDLIDSCNGLFLLRSSGTYYTCNPVTKHYFQLPDMIPFPEVDKQNLIDHSQQARLVFDPSISLSYKVIRYLPRGNIHQYSQIYVYSSETGLWRLSSTKIHDPATIMQKLNFPSVLLNGVLYWSYSITDEDVSICFDVEKECVWFLSLPPKPENYVRNCLYLGKCDGRLRLIERFEHVHKRHYAYLINLPHSFDIMETEPQQQHDGVHCIWTVKYHVNISRIYRSVRKEHGSVLHCYKTKDRRGNEEEVLLLKLMGRTIISFNLTGKKIMREIENPEKKTWIRNLTDVFTYTPTLFPV